VLLLLSDVPLYVINLLFYPFLLAWLHAQEASDLAGVGGLAVKKNQTRSAFYCLQGYLAHKETPNPQDPRRTLGISLG